jgi:ABC-type antimicrobial peptide transport system permease subunit
MLFEHMKLAWKDFGTNKLRTFLSILGIVIGVASVITITTLGGSATASIHEEVKEAGMNVMVVFPGRDSDREVRRLFTQELGERIEDEVEGIDTVLPINSGTFLIRHGKESYESTVYAVDERFPSTFDYEVDRGRFIQPEENERRRSVAVLGSEIAAELFPDGDAVGSYVRIFREGVARSFTVVGVMKTRTETMRLDFDTAVYVPYETYTQRVQKLDEVQTYYVKADDGADVLETADRVEELFLDVTQNEDSYRVMSPMTMVEMYTDITETLNLFLTGVAAISLIVGGIGIMNIMLVSVAERTREIGIRKALGAAPKAIRGQFLIEAVILTFLGGCIGMAMGTGLSFLGTTILGWAFTPRFWAYALAVVFSSGIGMFFGLYPAVRASRLNPIEALSYE